MLYLDYSNISASDKQYVSDALEKGHVSPAAPTTAKFEKAMAEYLNVPDAVATNSGTAALHLALLTCGIGPGNEVILPVTTFVATANAVSYSGAIPVFVDIDRHTWNIDLVQATRAITARTKAIVPVHLYGNPSDMEHIQALADFVILLEQKRYVIEDAAEAMGAKYQGEYTGTIGDYGCFSFNGNKITTSGGGGLVAGKNLDHIRYLSTQAKEEDGSHGAIGYNYRMPSFNAALGLGQLERLDEFLEKKRRFNQIYREELNGLVTFQEATQGSKPSWWFTACLFPENINIPVLQKMLYKQGIPTRRIFRPLTDSKPYQNGKEYPNARYIYDHGLCLPCSTLNKEEDICYVCKKIKEIIQCS